MNDFRKKLNIGGGILGLSIPLYLIPNHYPLFEPRHLPMTWVDQLIPFIPESIWIYHSEYPMLITAYLISDSNEALYRFWKSIVTVVIISSIIFFVFPTSYPRELFPLPESMNTISRFLFESQRTADTPLNCFPSLHVGAVISALFLVQNKPLRLKVLFGIWATLISISTMTTKQHYSWDVAGGLILAFSSHWYFRPKISRQ